MKVLRKLLAIAAIGLSISQCSKAPESPAPPAAASPPPAPPAPSAESKPAAAPADASASTSTDAVPLLSAALMEGRDYLLIPNGAPLSPQPGKIEVVELFNYACPACNTFEPKFVAWKRDLPAYVHVTYAALDFRPDFVPYARAYYAADVLGLVERTHEAVFDAIRS